MTKNDFVVMVLCVAAEKMKLDFACINRFISEIKKNGVDIANVLESDFFEGSVWQGLVNQARNMHPDCAKNLEQLSKRKIQIVSTENNHYPPKLIHRLKEKTPPYFLAVGNTELSCRMSVSVTGVRDVFEEDIKYARRLGEVCAREKLVVVSGGAVGVDSVVLQTVLVNGGQAVVYLPQSFEKSHFMYAYRKYAENGNLLCLSLCKPGQGFTSSGALERNVYIHSHGDITVTVRAKYKSGGSWSGASNNLERVRTPAYVSDIPSPGNEALKKMGAKVLTREQLMSGKFSLIDFCGI